MKARLLPDKEFRSIYSRVPRLCVDIVIKTDGGVILSKRDIPPAKGMWHIPGGTVLWGETLKDAVKRSAKEELGLVVRVGKILGVTEYSNKNSVGQSIGIGFLATPISGKLRGSWQAEEAKYFKTIPKNIIHEHRQFLMKIGMK